MDNFKQLNKAILAFCINSLTEKDLKYILRQIRKLRFFLKSDNRD